MRWKRLLWIPVLVFLGAMLTGLLFAGEIQKLYRSASYYLGEPTAAQSRVMEYARSHGVSYGEYPESLIALLERNPEAADFVLQYPFREELPVDLAEYRDCVSVPLFLQWDPRWGYEKYGSDVMGITGCGPTCLAMAGYYLTGDEDFSPDVVAEFSEDNGYYSPGNGSSWTLISQGAVNLGLDVTEIPLVKTRILDNLEVGNPIICSMGPGDFTEAGHYIVLVGTEDGKIRVNDPNSRINSGRLWSYEELEDQIRNLWVLRYFGATGDCVS